MNELNDAVLMSIAKTRAISEFLFTRYLEKEVDVDYMKDGLYNNVDNIAKKYFNEMKQES
jgi:hypothetical protein